MINNATLAATPSYSAAWDLAHQRYAEADARRMEELTRDARREVPDRRPYRPAEVRAVYAARMRRYRANQGTPIPPCSICGGPRTRRNGERCHQCRDKERCACGGVKWRWSSACAKCRGAR